MPRRTSLSLDLEDERAIAPFADSTSLSRAALVDWATEHGIDPTRLGSEASLLRILLRAGADSLGARALDQAYSTLAVELDEPSRRDEAQEARRRHVTRSERRVAS